MNAKQAQVNIGLIGHVDAGKTSLVQALTNSWVDTHSEELKRGISIRLGYADIGFYSSANKKTYFASNDGKDPNTKTKGNLERIVSFVDAPGHENLMTTMLSGAALMHGAILVVAANETCPQPQTVEHLSAIKLAGIQNIVVAQNKIDLVTKEDAIKNQKEILKFLKDFGFEKAPIIPTAAHHKVNISELIEQIEKTIPTPKFDLKKPLKMYCARSFDINKPGTMPEKLKGGVVGGTLIQGKIKKGDLIEISPGISNKPAITKVININSSQGPLTEAVPGGLIAIETEIDPSQCQSDMLRGQVIAQKGSLNKPTTSITLKTESFDRISKNKKTNLLKNDMVVLTVGTMSVIATINNVSKDIVEFTAKKPIVYDAETKVAISVKDNMKWRLAGYGTPKSSKNST